MKQNGDITLDITPKRPYHPVIKVPCRKCADRELHDTSLYRSNPAPTVSPMAVAELHLCRHTRKEPGHLGVCYTRNRNVRAVHVRYVFDQWYQGLCPKCCQRYWIDNLPASSKDEWQVSPPWPAWVLQEVSDE